MILVASALSRRCSSSTPCLAAALLITVLVLMFELLASGLTKTPLDLDTAQADAPVLVDGGAQPKADDALFAKASGALPLEVKSPLTEGEDDCDGAAAEGDVVG